MNYSHMVRLPISPCLVSFLARLLSSYNFNLRLCRVVFYCSDVTAAAMKPCKFFSGNTLLRNNLNLGWPRPICSAQWITRKSFREAPLFLGLKLGSIRYGRTKMEAKLKELFGEGMRETGTQVIKCATNDFPVATVPQRRMLRNRPRVCVMEEPLRPFYTNYLSMNWGSYRHRSLFLATSIALWGDYTKGSITSLR